MTSSPTVRARPLIQIFLPEGLPGEDDEPTFEWVTIKDVVSGVKAAYGIHSSSPTDRTADPGECTFDLDNGVTNSAGLRGYYSIGHPDCRVGFEIGAEVRLVLSHPLFGDVVKWRGTIQDAPAEPGIGNPVTHVVCVDWMEEAALTHPSGLGVMPNTQADAVFSALLGAIPSEKQPPEVSVSSGSDVYPFALDNVQDESSTIKDEFNKLSASEFGYIYVKAGRLTFEGRSIRAAGGSPRFTFDEDDMVMAMGIAHSRSDILNRIQVSVHPRRVDVDNDTVLFTLGSAQRIERRSSITINAQYRDPNQQAQRAGGIDMQDPLPGRDCFLNTHEDGSGLDITSQLTASYVGIPGGNSANVNYANAGPKDGFLLAGAQLLGRGLFDFEPIGVDVQDDDSVSRYGQNYFPYDMPYQSSPGIASDTAEFILSQGARAKTRTRTLTFMGNWSLEVLAQVFGLDISDKIIANAPSVAVTSEQYYINGVTLDISRAGAIKVTYDLSPVDVTAFWTLEVDGMTELDETTVLGYGLFVTRWIMDVDALGVSTYLN